jgi:uncharacterized protein YjiS (DUF1127 family)
MKHLPFAIASIVDANTGFGLSHGGGKIDYRAAEQHERAIRAKSIITLFTAVKQRIGIAVEAYRVRVQAGRDLQKLLNLNDRMLNDIGLTRGDLASVQYGAVTLKQLDAERKALRQVTDQHVTTSIRVEKVNQAQEAVNQELYAEAKCA